MNRQITPEPDQWYLDRQNGDMFQVISVNEDDGSIDIQYADGTVAEKPRDEWASMEIEACEQPEDWVGPYDDLEADDIGMPEASVEAHLTGQPMERALLDIEERRESGLNEE